MRLLKSVATVLGVASAVVACSAPAPSPAPERPSPEVIKASFNSRAQEINARMKSTYERAQRACANFERSGRRSLQCPPKAPEYVETY